MFLGGIERDQAYEMGYGALSLFEPLVLNSLLLLVIEANR